MVIYNRANTSYRLFPYVEDFLAAPLPTGVVSMGDNFERARKLLGGLLERLGVRRHTGKGYWEGGMRLEHLGVHMDTGRMRVFMEGRVVVMVSWRRGSCLSKIGIGGWCH